MAMTQHEMIRARRPRRQWHLRPVATFAGAALFGGGVVAMLAAWMPGGDLATVGLAVGLYALGAAVAAFFLQRDYPHDSLGAGNYVTLGRLVLVGALIAPLLAGIGPSWSVFAVAAGALGLDGLDGWLARSQGHVSEFGARFDMEVDSALALILAINVAVGSEFGLAALLLGLPRYAFGLASLGRPWMRRALPERFSRKLVCVLQLGTLIALQAPVLPSAPGALMVLVVAAALLWSFTTDVVWLWRRRG